MKKIFALSFLLFALIASVCSLPAAEHAQRSHSKKRCNKCILCPKKFKLPRVDITTTPVECEGAMVFNTTDGFVYYSDGTNWIALEDKVPAPSQIIVDPVLVANGVTTFNTLQSAIDSLGNQKIVGTTISVANGTYPETLNLTSILSSDSSKLVIQGDLRDIVGCGINHGSFWNVGGSGPVGGISANGSAILAGLAGSATLSVTGDATTVPPTASPDFIGCNVVAGDRVLIRHNDGTFATYTVAAVAPTVLTFTSNLAVNVNAAGAALCVIPKVEIAPPTGSPAAILQGTQIKLAGLFINSPTGVTGIRIYPYSNTAFDNVLMFGSSGLIANPATSASNFAHPSLTTLGGRNFGSTFFFDGTGTAITIQNYGTFVPANSLIAARPGGRVLISARSLIAGGNTRFLSNISVSSMSYLATIFGNLDIITQAGTGLYLEYGSLATANTGRWRILGTPNGAPNIGIDCHDSRVVLKLAPVTFNSNDATFIPIRLGSQAVGGENADVSMNLGSITMTSPGPIAQVLNGSRLSITSVAGPLSLGSATSGFQVYNNSVLTWNATNVIPSTSSTGILFDIRGDSSLVMPSASPNRLLSNFQTIFNFDDNSKGSLNNVTCTTTAGGTNLVVSNMSRVELGTATFNLPTSGSNTGIATSFGGFVGKKGGAVITNSATSAISATSCAYGTGPAFPTSANPCYYDSGLIQVTP